MIENLVVLVVEDDQERQSAFKEELFDCDLTLADNAGHAIALLSSRQFDCVFLDYDLSTRGGEGRIIAEALASGRNGSAKVIVHSMNLAGAMQMRKFLPQCKIIPFSDLRGNILATMQTKAG